ncbi:alpha/beta hydrolase [Acetobacteraceae bacterium H6797]|nr:alpha/beta hydrolase [Acetobacteraceae bacterium H6797]
MRVFRRCLAIVALLGAALFLTGQYVTPWPNILLIRGLFHLGAAHASAGLEEHVPHGLIVRKALRYDERDPEALLDIYRPETLDPQAPTVLWVHGGGFVSGTRHDLSNYTRILAGQGFAVVNIGYSIAPGSTYPKPIRQVTKALAWLVEHGAELGIDPARLVLAGDSAGAQIAAQVANLVTAPGYAKALGIASPIAPAQLKGVLLFCGLYDLDAFDEESEGVIAWFAKSMNWAYSGSRDWRAVPGYELASVARALTPAFPPSFITVGNDDPLRLQSVLMDEALRAQGVRVDALFYPRGHVPPLGHEYQFDLDGEAGRLALARAVAFLRGL